MKTPTILPAQVSFTQIYAIAEWSATPWHPYLCLQDPCLECDTEMNIGEMRFANKYGKKDMGHKGMRQNEFVILIFQYTHSSSQLLC